MAEFLEEAIRLRALQTPGIVALTEERWYGPNLPRPTKFPAVTMMEVSRTPEHSHSGNSHLDTVLLQVTLHGPCHLKLMRLRDLITHRFDAFRGNLFGIEIGYLKCLVRGRGKESGQDIYMLDIDMSIKQRMPILAEDS